MEKNEREGRVNGRGKRGEVNEGKRKAGEGGLRKIGGREKGEGGESEGRRRG